MKPLSLWGRQDQCPVFISQWPSSWTMNLPTCVSPGIAGAVTPGLSLMQGGERKGNLPVGSKPFLTFVQEPGILSW